MAELPTVGFVGAGRAAGVIAPELAEAGYPVVAVASRMPASASALAARLPGCSAATLQAVADAAEVVFITTGDGAIAGVAEAIRWPEARAAVHCSGALTLLPLEAARLRGAAVGSWHPFQTLTGSASLVGVTFGIEADTPLFDVLAEMARRVGGTALSVPGEVRVLYHAASVMSCGYLTTLLREAHRLWERAGLPAQAATPAIAKLASTTLANVVADGAGASLTGPTSRGDVDTVRLHLEAIASASPELLPLYAALSQRAVALATEAGRATGDADWDSLFAAHMAVAAKEA